MKIKVWLWISYSVIVAILNCYSIQLGAIPSVVLFSIVLFLSKQLDKNNEYNGKRSENKEYQKEYEPTTERVTICASCGYREGDFNLCPQCGGKSKFFKYINVDERSNQE